MVECVGGFVPQGRRPRRPVAVSRGTSADCRQARSGGGPRSPRANRAIAVFVGDDRAFMPPELRRALGLRDLILFYVATTFSLRWVALAAGAGPSALVLWIVAAAFLFVPLVFTVLELSSRYPDEGGLYVWTKRAFGPF